MRNTRTVPLTLLLITLVVGAACHSTKKSTTLVTLPPVTTTTPVTNTPAATAAGPALPARSVDGIYAPGNEELLAAQAQYPDATLDKLKQGYAIYTAGACVNCHGTMSIYKYSVAQWKPIIDDMALKAMISDAQKDAVYKYVLAIKAVQQK